jgi:hypothetical protein
MISRGVKRTQIRPSTWILLALIAVLGSGLVVRQRQEARLRAALALYQGRAHKSFVRLLNRPIPLVWPDETPLAEVIGEIKLRTQGPGLPQGLPITIDTAGLEEAVQSLTSPVKGTSMDEPLPLRERLARILEPLGLAYRVQNDSIRITSRRAVEAAPASLDQAAEDEEDPN